jgi:membrane protein implicated in regulation of membrane protease activity
MKLTKVLLIIVINIGITLIGTAVYICLMSILLPGYNWSISAIVFFCIMLLSNWIIFQIIKNLNKKIKK